MPWALRRWGQEDQKYKVIFYHTSRLSWDRRLSQHEMQRGSRAHLFALVVLFGTVSHDIRLEAAIQRMASYSSSCQEGFQVCITMPSPHTATLSNLCVTFRTRQNYSCLYSEILTNALY